MGMVSIAYFIACGGPLGSEPVISAAGPLIGLLAMVLYPLLVTIPYAYILAELCTAFPEDGGFVVWVLNAFGPFWGFQVGYWSWIGGVLNGALLPGFLLKTLLDYFQYEPTSTVVQYLLKAAIAIVVSAPTFLGTRIVARACLALMGLVLLPMVAFSIWGYAVGHDLKDLLEVRRAGDSYFDEEKRDQVLTGPIEIDWALLLNTLFWNFDGIAMASVFGGEVSNPARVYPRAIFFTVVLTVLTYLVPMPAAIITETPHWSTYERDSYPFIALTIGGRVLEKIVLLACVSGIIGRMLSGLYCKSFQVCGMAENYLLPISLADRNLRFDSPHVAIAATLSATLMLLSVDFSYLLPVANAFLCAVQLLIIAASVRLRLFLPFIPRPTKVPGGVCATALFAVLPTVVLGYIIYDAVQTTTTAVLISSLLVPGILGGAYQQFRSNAALSPLMFA
jgi:amino acid transporter